MTLIVSCKKCGKELRAQDQYAGKRTRCSQCGTINQLPARPATMPAPLVESAFCFICGKDFSVDKDLVRDKKKRTYHRRCYEDASRYQQSRQGEARSRSPKSGAEPRAAVPAPRAPARSAPTPASSPLVPRDELIELTELPAPSDDLWADLSGPANPLLDASPFQGSSPGAFSGRKDAVWLYVLIGFGAAVPVVVLLFIAIQLLISSFTGPEQSVATADPSAVTTEEGTPEQTAAPEASPPAASAQSPAQPDNPFLLPEETSTRRGEPSTTEPSPAQPAPPSDLVSPPSGPFPNPEPEPGEQPAQPSSATLGQRLAALGAAAVLTLVCLSIILVPIGAVLLRVACSICGETQPGFGAALGISFAMFTAKMLVGLVLAFLLGQGAGGIVSFAAGLMSDGAIISGALPTSFGKGIVIAVVMTIIVIGLVLAICAFLYALIAMRGT